MWSVEVAVVNVADVIRMALLMATASGAPSSGNEIEMEMGFTCEKMEKKKIWVARREKVLAECFQR